jgi:ubiquinone/menaquinone biosynthesis C-methylase UbiE
MRLFISKVINRVINRVLVIRHYSIRRRDIWFYEHYFSVARYVTSFLRLFVGADRMKHADVLEFGCGDGITALGVSKSVGKLHAVDLTTAFEHLPEKARTLLLKNGLPENLEFHQVVQNESLPFDHNFFDAAFSWSVFEHVKDLPGALKNIYGVLRCGGVLFIQIAPLYYSAYGSHLKRLGIKPWEHLILSDEELFAVLKNRKTNIGKREQDILYEKSDREEFYNYLLNEYKSLNKKTIKEIVYCCESAGFSVENLHLGRDYLHMPNKYLLRKYDRQELINRELWIILRKPN